jgi:hypothetical protein
MQDKIEQALAANLFQPQTEKTYIDKLLAKQEIEQIRVLVKKDKLTRSELLELLYLCSSAESKLLNYGEWDRYVILKFFVWIREFTKIAELLYDYREFLEEKKKKGEYVLTDRTVLILDNTQNLLLHNIKFLVDLYLNIGRTSLSIGATGWSDISTGKYDISYSQDSLKTPQQNEDKSTRLFGGKKERPM